MMVPSPCPSRIVALGEGFDRLTKNVSSDSRVASAVIVTGIVAEAVFAGIVSVPLAGVKSLFASVAAGIPPPRT